VTSRPPDTRSRSTTTDGGPVSASRRPTARARVLAPSPPDAPTTAMGDRWLDMAPSLGPDATAFHSRTGSVDGGRVTTGVVDRCRQCFRAARDRAPRKPIWTRTWDGPGARRGPPTGPEQRVWIRTWDGPGRGDNRGRRRAELRGGEAGPPFAQPLRGASEPIVSHDGLHTQAPATTCRDHPQDLSESTGSEGWEQKVQSLTTTGIRLLRWPARRRLHPVDWMEASSCRDHPGRPGVLHAVVAVGQAHHDRSISGLPARGYPFVPR
jgi:hypothetical protein